MAMLADSVEVVIGVDTHKQTHTAAVVAAATGQTMATLTVAATPAGYQQLLEAADQHGRSGCGRSRAPAATAPS
jgi:transposase